MIYKIVKILPDSKESENHIVDAYALLDNGRIKFEVFVTDWTTYFPYYPKQSKWGLGQALISNLTGKSIEAELKLVDLEPFQKTLEKKKNISQEGGIAYHTTIFGEIIKKEEYNPADYSNAQLCPDPNKYEKLLVDCGLRLRVSTEKGKFKVGDYITGKGILQAYFKKIGGEKV